MKQTRLLALLILSVFLLGACKMNSSQPLRIGVISYFSTGDESIRNLGSETENAVSLFELERKEAGPLELGNELYQVQVVVAAIDDGKQNAAVEAAQSLIDQGVAAIVGPQRNEDMAPVIDLAEKMGVPLILGAPDAKLLANKKYVFRLSVAAQDEAKLLANFVTRELALKRVAVVHDLGNSQSQDMAKIFADQIVQNGGEPVQVSFAKSNDLDFVQSILDARPALVFLPSSDPVDVVFRVKALREAGYQGFFLGSSHWNERALRKLPLMDGSYTATFYSASISTPNNHFFVSQYQKMFDVEPGQAAGATYDGLNLVLSAAKLKQSTLPADIQAGLLALPSYDAVTGPIDFTASGTPEKPLIILFFENGQMSFYKALRP